MPNRIPVLCAGIALVALAACSGGSGGSASDTSAPATSVVLGTSDVVASLGRVIAADNGVVVYGTAGEAGGKLDCSSDCQATWPVVAVRSAAAIHFAKNTVARPALVGTIAGPGGSRVVTYAGYPLHTFVGDAQSPGVGEGIGGYFAITPAGQLTRAAANVVPTSSP